MISIDAVHIPMVSERRALRPHCLGNWVSVRVAGLSRPLSPGLPGPAHEVRSSRSSEFSTVTVARAAGRSGPQAAPSLVRPAGGSRGEASRCREISSEAIAEALVVVISTALRRLAQHGAALSEPCESQRNTTAQK
jgi:hypothetical protein